MHFKHCVILTSDITVRPYSLMCLLLPVPSTEMTSFNYTITHDSFSCFHQAVQRGVQDCPICLNPLGSHNGSSKEDRSVLLLSCSHLFHEPCLQAFELFCHEVKPTCPLCRSHYAKMLVSNQRSGYLLDCLDVIVYIMILIKLLPHCVSTSSNSTIKTVKSHKLYCKLK